MSIVLSAVSALHAAAAEKTLIAFKGYPVNGELQTGSLPDGTLLRDANGALYGTNMGGGAYYNGTVFKLTPPAPGQTAWRFSLLYTFTGGADGGFPNPNLVMDSSGALYGTTGEGGTWLNQGIVYKLTPAPGETQWKLTVLHTFYSNYADGGGDGANPGAGLIMDRAGALYGTTANGGNMVANYEGSGTVFKMTPLDSAKTKWQETILYTFQGGADGHNPRATLTFDSAGALYGSTLYGGTGNCVDFLNYPQGCGTVFKLTPPSAGHTTWSKATLHSFAAGADGWIPQGKLLLDRYGSVYGVTYQGGRGACTDELLNIIGCGVVFRLAPPITLNSPWTESVIHDFSGPDGAAPQGGVIFDASGALVGATSAGGPVSYGVVGSYGVVYRLVPPPTGRTAWTESVLYDFDISTSGDYAVGELVADPQGHLFGVSYKGGANLAGTVFEILP